MHTHAQSVLPGSMYPMHQVALSSGHGIRCILSYIL